MKNNGGKIPEEYKEKIYEQGFSTKEGQRGQGMYIIKKIINEFNGTIYFEENDGVLWNITIPMMGSEKIDSSNHC